MLVAGLQTGAQHTRTKAILPPERPDLVVSSRNRKLGTADSVRLSMSGYAVIRQLDLALVTARRLGRTYIAQQVGSGPTPAKVRAGDKRSKVDLQAPRGCPGEM
jgi:hypothetical protein